MRYGNDSQDNEPFGEIAKLLLQVHFDTALNFQCIRTPTCRRAARAMLKDWITDLESFSKRLGLARPPKLVVKQSRFLPLFPFTSWTPKPGAWAGMGRIIVSAALLDCSADRRQYLLAHELGHIAERYSRRGLRILLAVTVSGSLSFFRDYLPKSIKIIDAAAFIYVSAYMLYSIGSYRVELEADAVASSLIGVDAVERGTKTL
jgi:Zn-dependent protease with chaperone function